MDPVVVVLLGVAELVNIEVESKKATRYMYRVRVRVEVDDPTRPIAS